MGRAQLLFLTGWGFGTGVVLGLAWGLMWPHGPVTRTPPSRKARPRQPSGGTAVPRSAA
jgi:hypothetical protein